MGSRSADTWRLAPKSARVPFWHIVGDQRQFCGKDPPITAERQISASDLVHGDILPPTNFMNVLIETTAQGPPTFRQRSRCFAQIDQLAAIVKGIDSACLRTNGFFQRQQRASFQLSHYLRANAAIEVKLEIMRIVYNPCPSQAKSYPPEQVESKLDVEKWGKSGACD